MRRQMTSYAVYGAGLIVAAAFAAYPVWAQSEPTDAEQMDVDATRQVDEAESADNGPAVKDRPARRWREPARDGRRFDGPRPGPDGRDHTRDHTRAHRGPDRHHRFAGPPHHGPGQMERAHRGTDRDDRWGDRDRAKRHDMPGRAHAMKVLMSGVELDVAQREQVHGIAEAHREQMKAHVQAGQSLREAVRDAARAGDEQATQEAADALREHAAEGRALRQSLLDRIRDEVLTEEQRERFEQNRETMRERMEQMQGWREGRPGPGDARRFDGPPRRDWREQGPRDRGARPMRPRDGEPPMQPRDGVGGMGPRDGGPMGPPPGAPRSDRAPDAPADDQLDL